MLEFQPDEADAGPAHPGSVTMLVWNWRVYFEFPVLLLRMLCVFFLRTRQGWVFEGSASAPVQTHSNISREQVQCGVVAVGDAGCHESGLQNVTGSLS